MLRWNSARYNKSKVERFHVLLMVELVWDDWCGDVEGNQHPIIERGWNPLNTRGCLVNSDIEKKKPDGYVSGTEVCENFVGNQVQEND